MEENNNELFAKILDEDETIEKIIKPNKQKLYWSTFFASIFILIWFLLFGLASILLPDETEAVTVSPIFVLIPIGVFILAIALILVFCSIYYKNVFYACTNKRLIIRTGIFGIDYKSLDFSMIGAVDVYVSVLDKILKKDTGTVCFGSMASPMQSTKGTTSYKFSNITAPYETCKQIKSYIDRYKELKKNNY